ncbi:hypothetical protein M409DRAFT_36553 [Zasmidium cellare ATCC 36951]|uniref:Ecp2 effector protein domain-containing protein n=1 Tax=Zasmidium cellare ATCC 36951 TaxID=1080233 RepID=A0A6A6CJZ9_ZASCE|nr:uncharacterized protein M409DRAFT_36553 [Zasmidium cellare ATCC 36951]KAF2167557.1 hypothetical protein M409DRAFT_36553 [Zasmidium cellare ATCC 36951]
MRTTIISLAALCSAALAAPVTTPAPVDSELFTKRDVCLADASILYNWWESGWQRYRIAFSTDQLGGDNNKILAAAHDVWGGIDNDSCGQAYDDVQNVQIYYNDTEKKTVVDVSQAIGPVGQDVINCLAHNFQQAWSNKVCPNGRTG